MLIELSGLPVMDVYHLLTQVIVPRPIAWVVSDNGEDAAHRWNLAPFSYFNAVASDPPTVMVSIDRSRRADAGGPAVKDTLTNLSSAPHHTIALAALAHLDIVEATSTDVAPGASEFELAGIAPLAWDWSVPMPAGVRVALGCTVDRIVPIGDGPQRMVLSRVERVWLDDALAGEDERGRLTIDPAALDPLMRLGGGGYAGLGPVLRPLRSARPGR